jgi:hypothetical protein
MPPPPPHRLLISKQEAYNPLSSPTQRLCENLISDLCLSLVFRALSAQEPLGICFSVFLYNLSSFLLQIF